MIRCFLVFLSLVVMTGKATASLESVADSMRAKVIQVGQNRSPLPSRARDLSVEVPQGARKVGKTSHFSEYIQHLPSTSCISASRESSNIQGFMVEESGVSKLVYIDVSELGDHRKLSFGENAVATPFTGVQINSLKVKELEKKLNLN